MTMCRTAALTAALFFGSFMTAPIAAADSSSYDASDSSPSFLQFVLGVCVICAVPLAACFVYGAWKKRRVRRDAQNAAIKAKTDANTKRFTHEPIAKLEVQLDTAMDGMPEPMVTEYRAVLDGIDVRTKELSDKFDNLVAQSDSNPDDAFSTARYDELAKAYDEIVAAFDKEAKDFTALLAKVESDKAALTPEGRNRRMTAIDQQLGNLDDLLQTCEPFFTVAVYQQQLESIHRSAESARLSLKGPSPYESHLELAEVEQQLSALAEKTSEFPTALERISTAADILQTQVRSTRETLGGLEYADTDDAKGKLRDCENRIDEFVRSTLSPKLAYDVQVKLINDFVSEIAVISDGPVQSEKKMRARIQKERDDAAAAARRRSDDNLLTGIIIGELLS